MKINHNISAQLANVNLKKTNDRLSLSMQKLSSGYKITKAADDSAGLAISNKMRTQIRALDRSAQNAEDGVSIIESADGALAEIHSVLQRVRELCVQNANDTYTIEDRETAQKEVDQLMDEIDRISSTTEFNGRSLFDGSASRTIASSFDGVKGVSVSMEATAGTYTIASAVGGTCGSVDDVLRGVTYPVPSDMSISINGESISMNKGDSKETVEKKVVSACSNMNLSYDSATGKVSSNIAGHDYYVQVSFANGTKTKIDDGRGTDASVTLKTVADGKVGFTANAKVSAVGNKINIIDNDGFEMNVELPTEKGAAKNYSDVDFAVYDAGYMTIQIGANEHQTFDMNFPTVSCDSLGLRAQDGKDLLNVCTNYGASTGIALADSAIRQISSARAELGAYQNRLETTVSSLNVFEENMTDSMSRIIDTDMASEMTEYTQLTVLQQASTSMLSQANNRPQTIMSLLQGM
ncbi:flagellin [Eubacterium sp. MSJ-13]|uniref:flagellin N-terminal helical domain-containing protein n=1 Tax=Eubacterium sp. MSJ-13 TaxID=2841513 RepID=UPI001C11F46D|nr:flagellin [Eubacterium sp. MSJ-13]MBU5479493.1 flagellin [Eubacterium sp. MSJ-13]